ncbi:MAG: glutathione S-transferase family protein [Hyphomicrobiales bacterium]
MGVLFEGEWRRDGIPTDDKGRFQRQETSFRNWVSADPEAEFPAEAERYHLYVSYACPWAHRTLIFRMLKGLEDMVSVSVVHHFMGDDGWTFAPGEGVVPDTVNGKRLLREVYLEADPGYTGRVTVPVLWDKTAGTIVSNESSEIIRMFNSAFDGVGARDGDYYPEALREEIDEVNERVFHTVNNGVYRAGFSGSQAAYDEAVNELFETLDWLDERLKDRRYLMGDRVTEADWRLLPTLLRFDPVYVTHFKCNRKRIIDYPHLWTYTRDLYQHPGIAGTVNMDHIKKHYFGSHTSINPTGIVPAGPDIDYSEPQDRARLSQDLDA